MKRSNKRTKDVNIISFNECILANNVNDYVIFVTRVSCCAYRNFPFRSFSLKFLWVVFFFSLLDVVFFNRERDHRLLQPQENVSRFNKNQHFTHSFEVKDYTNKGLCSILSWLRLYTNHRKRDRSNVR